MNRFSLKRNKSKIERLWSSALGTKTCALQMPELAPLTRRLHGDVVLWVGDCQEAGLALQGCMIRHTIFAAQNHLPSTAQQQPMLQVDLTNLPFASASLDGVVLHHGLELVADPRAAIKEVERVLVQGGKLLICGFNPFSLYGLRRLYSRVFADPMSAHVLVNPMRLFDWLALLDLKLDCRPKYFEYSLPISQNPLGWINDWLRSSPWLKRKINKMSTGFSVAGRRLKKLALISQLPFGGVLLISATKQAASMNMQTIEKHAKKTKQRSLKPAALHKISINKKTNIEI
jgi:SAM-dependent methyltransferase